MKSMTGYGKGVATLDGYELTIELKTVNNRFLEVNNRIPKAFVAYDTLVRSVLAKKLSRGSVEVYYNYRSLASSDRHIALDEGLVAQYLSVARTLERHGMSGALSTADLLRFPDVVISDDVEMSEEIKKTLVISALELACATLSDMRAEEGATLARDLNDIVEDIRTRLTAIKARAPEIVQNYQARLRAHVQEFLDTVSLDEARLMNEIAVYSDRVDTNEEMQRLSAHLDAFQSFLATETPVGRNLDFLTQELTREANTLGTKCSDLPTTNLILEIKNEIEKLKEQSRNAE